MGIGGRMNNYEKIKNMTIDEMVQLLEGDCFRCAYCKLDDCWKQDCDNGHKQWLKQESEE